MGLAEADLFNILFRDLLRLVFRLFLFLSPGQELLKLVHRLVAHPVDEGGLLLFAFSVSVFVMSRFVRGFGGLARLTAAGSVGGWAVGGGNFC